MKSGGECGVSDLRRQIIRGKVEQRKGRINIIDQSTLGIAET